MTFNRPVRFFIDAPFHWWRLIISTVVLLSILGTTLGYTAFRYYEAVAGVTIVRSRTQVSFDTAIQTLSEEELLIQLQKAQTQQAVRADLSARRQTLVAMVNDANIANEISHDPTVRQYLSPEDLEPGHLSAMVQGRLALNPGAERDQSELIQIAVQNPNPAAAAAIANAWAVAYERRVNEIYGMPASSDGPTDPEVAESRQKYERLQRQVIEFLRTSHKEEYEREIGLLRAVLEQFQNARVELIDALVNERQSIDAQLEHALVLYDQARGGADGNTMGLVIALEKMRMVGVGLPDQTQLSLSDIQSFAPEDLVKETRSMVQALQVQQAVVDNAIRVQQQMSLNGVLPPPTMPMTASLLLQQLQQKYPELQANQDLYRVSRYDPTLPITETLTRTMLITTSRVPSLPAPNMIAMGNPLLADVTPILQRIRELDAQIDRESMSLKDLTTQRNLAYDTYTTLDRKQTESQVAKQVPGSEVHFSTFAGIPVRPAIPTWAILLASLVLGGILGTLLSYLAEVMFDPERATPRRGPLGWVLMRQPLSFTERLATRLSDDSVSATPTSQQA